jgi:hypothetical protein
MGSIYDPIFWDKQIRADGVFFDEKYRAHEFIVDGQSYTGSDLNYLYRLVVQLWGKGQ